MQSRAIVAAGILLVGLLASTGVSAQGPALPSLLRAAVTGLGLSVAADQAGADVIDESVDLVVTYSVTRADDVRVSELPAGAMLPAVGRCPPGWDHRAAADGAPLYIPLGWLVDAEGNVRVQNEAVRLPACVRR